MAVYAIGDVQGCYDSLQALLAKINFSAENDQLWFAGDLVNRGPKSLQTLRFIRSLGSAATIVLGNHDLHLLAICYGDARAKNKDTLDDLKNANDADELLAWLRQQALAKYDSTRDFLLVHAGIPPQWTVTKALKYAQEVENVIQSDSAHDYFKEMYGNCPDKWHKKLKGFARLRVITNYFTRMRFIDKQGRLDLKAKQGIDSAPKGFDAWFNYSRSDQTKILFGHWAAIQGLTNKKQFVALDTGCVWGDRLRAFDVDTGEIYEVCACDKKAGMSE